MLGFLCDLVLEFSVEVVQKGDIFSVLGVVLNVDHVPAFLFSVMKEINVHLVDFFTSFLEKIILGIVRCKIPDF